MEQNEMIKHWVESAEQDYTAMEHLFEKKDLLDIVSTFNLRARYADYKQAFRKKCTKMFTENWIKNIKEFSEWIKINYLN